MRPPSPTPALLAAAASLATLLAAQPTPLGAAAAFTTDFSLGRCKWSSTGRQNPYWSLTPGDQNRLESEDGAEVVVITVLDATRPISFKTEDGATISLNARVIEERESEDGALKEVSRNFFARCTQTNDVFYFGEEVDDYENGQIVGHGGAWEAGKNGALPGLIIPARFLLGERYFQEIAAADEALDRAENAAMGFNMTLAGRTWRDCVKVIETSPLEPGDKSLKVYCPGVGMVVDEEIFLTAYRRN